MKKAKRYIFTIIIAISLMVSGCSKKGSTYENVSKMLQNMNTYTVSAKINVYEGKNIENFIIKQYYKYPDKYRLEVLEPSKNKGKITVYDGENLYIYNPNINQSVEIQNIKNAEDEFLFPGYFAGRLFTSEKIEYYNKNIDTKDYFALKIKMPYGNKYRDSMILYIDEVSLKPVILEILDSQENINIKVFYTEFCYNVDIKDSFFTKDGIKPD